MKILVNVIKRDEEIIYRSNEKEVKFLLFFFDVIVYLERLYDLIEILLKLVNEFSKEVSC